MKVYIDPYSANDSDSNQYYCVGYKGANAYDAGLFYCPYVPLQMVRAVARILSNQKLDLRQDTVYCC